MTFDVATEIVVRRAKRAAATRAWRAANPERARELARQSMARYRDNHPERSKEVKRRSYWKNPEKSRAASLAWAKANPEKARERTRRWRRQNPERYLAAARVYESTRRALKIGAKGFHSIEDVAARFAVHGNCCVYCGTEQDLTVDHRIPLSRGGSEWPANLVPACATCNKSKGTRTHLEFVALRAA